MLTLSKTSLEQFMSGCNYRFPLYRKYTRLRISRYEKFGIAVHQMLEAGVPESPDDNLSEWEIADKLETMVDKLGYHILDREVKHIAKLTDGIQVFGIIDAIAELDGEPVLIDYKTGGRAWKTITTEQGEIVVPKAAGFQGPIYLTKPYGGSISDYWGNGLWPGELHYLYAPNTGVTKRHRYYKNDIDDQNLLHAAGLLKDAVDRGWFPKNVGWQCEGCDWRNVCYKTPGWEKYHGEK